MPDGEAVPNREVEARTGRLTYDVRSLDDHVVTTIELRADGLWHIVDDDEALGGPWQLVTDAVSELTNPEDPS